MMSLSDTSFPQRRRKVGTKRNGKAGTTRKTSLTPRNM
jgi:hypothetical protein